MSAVYPTGIVTTANLPVGITDGTPVNNPDHAGQHVQLNYEVTAIETALGTSPQGSYATVSAALTTHGTLITAAQTTANTAVSAASVAQTTATAALTTAAGAVAKSLYTGNGVLIAGTATSGNVIAIAGPGTNGYLLSATPGTTGGMAWVAPNTYPAAGIAVSPGTAGPWSASYTVGTAASNIVQLTTGGQFATGISPFSSQNVVTGSRALSNSGNHIYQNTTGKHMLVSVSISCSQNNTNPIVKTDSGATPSTVVCATYNASNTNEWLMVTFVVLNSNYYQIETAGLGALQYWTEWY